MPALAVLKASPEDQLLQRVLTSMPRVLQAGILRRAVRLQTLHSRSAEASSSSSATVDASCQPNCRCSACSKKGQHPISACPVRRQYSTHMSGHGLSPAMCSRSRGAQSPYTGHQHGQHRAALAAEHLPSRLFSTIEEHQNVIEEINEAFVNARDEIEYAKEDSETVYFNEAHDTAKAAVGEALGKFEGLLAALDKPEADKLQRSMGMKMQQLKAELMELDELHA